MLADFGGAPTGYPNWSPDGSMIAFEGHPDGNADIHVVSSQGGSPRRLTRHVALDARPFWSRDGQWIYFISNRSGSSQIWRVPAAAEEDPAAEEVTTGGAEYGVQTIDGSALVYSRGLYASSLYMMEAGGGEEKELAIDGTLAGIYSFEATERGIYYVAFAGEEEELVLGRYDLASRSARTLFPMESPPMGCFTASMDGRVIIYPRLERLEGDLMLVQGLR
jgi:Tol biopolymer transport system component